MGLEVAAVVMAGVEVGLEVAKSSSQMSAAEAQTRALELQAEQATIQTQQKTLSNYDIMEKVLDAQTAYMTTTGNAFSSPSFNAIQRQTLNIGAKKGRNIELEGELQAENIEIEKENVKNTLYAQLFGNVANAANKAYSFSQKMPRLEE
jgi:hypothetical protein